MNLRSLWLVALLAGCGGPGGTVHLAFSNPQATNANLAPYVAVSVSGKVTGMTYFDLEADDVPGGPPTSPGRELSIAIFDSDLFVGHQYPLVDFAAGANNNSPGTAVMDFTERQTGHFWQATDGNVHVDSYDGKRAQISVTGNMAALQPKAMDGLRDEMGTFTLSGTCTIDQVDHVPFPTPEN